MLSWIKSKSYKIIISAAVLFAAITIVHMNAFANSYTDISKCPEYARSAILSLDYQKIINGAGDDKFYPDRPTTKAQIVTVIVKALNLDTTNIPDIPDFKDVPKDHWAYRYVEAAYKAGIIKGTGQNMFGINDLCTREQLAKMLVNALKLPEEAIQAQEGASSEVARFEDRDRIAAWAVNEVSYAVRNKIMNGTSDTSFSPDSLATREQMAVVIDRYLRSDIPVPVQPASTTFVHLTLLNQNGSTRLIFSSLKPMEGAGLTSISDESGRLLKHEIPFAYMDYNVTYTNILHVGDYLREEIFYYKTEHPNKNEFLELENGKTYTVKYSYKLKGSNTQRIYVQEKVAVQSSAYYVESVMPINASQLRVTFSRGVSSTSATDTSNYALTDENGRKLGIKNIKVLPGDCVAIVNLLEPNTTPKNITVAIKNIVALSSDNSPVAPYTEMIPLDDRVKPSVEGLSTTNDGKNFTSITLTFSEPVYSGTIYVNKVPVGQASGEVETIPGLSFDGTQSLQVNIMNLSDGVNSTNNAGTSSQRLFDPPKKETVPPVITGTSCEKDTAGRVKGIVLTFSEGLKLDYGYPASQISAYDKDNNKVEVPLVVKDPSGNPIQTDAKVLCYTSEKVEQGSTKVIFPLADGLNIYSGKYTFHFPKDLVYDLEGNGSEESTQIIDFDAR